MQIHSVDTKTKLSRPLYISRVSAGFPSPAEDYVDVPLDLNEHLIKHPAATFFVRVQGNSMIDAGINSGDILIVDKSLEAKHSNIVVAIIEGEFLVKQLSKRGEEYFLVAANQSYSPIKVEENTEIWGVVTYVIHSTN